MFMIDSINVCFILLLVVLLYCFCFGLDLFAEVSYFIGLSFAILNLFVIFPIYHSNMNPRHPIEMMRRCNFFFNVFGLEIPDYLECSQFTDSNNPDICIGQRQIRESYNRALKPGNCHPQPFLCCGILFDLS